MKRVHLLGLLIVAVLALTPLAALAQDETEFEEYTTEDGKLSLSYPADWFIETASEDAGAPAVAFAQSEETLERVINDDEMNLQPGEAVMMVLLIPAGLLEFMGVTLTEDTTPVELTETVVQAFLEVDEGDEEGTPEAVEIGEVEEVQLDKKRTVGYVEAANDKFEGGFIIMEIVDDVILISYVGTAPGEYNDELADLLTQVVASVEFTGTSEEMMEALMGGGTETEEPMGTTLDGATLVEERCTICHTTDRINQADKDEEGWTATVDRMIGYGAQLNDEERTAVIDYLVANH